MICSEYPSEIADDTAAPAESQVIDPEIGFEIQKFLIFRALVNLPDSYKQDFVDMMRIFRLGTDAAPLFPAAEQATWIDPLSGQSYVAHRYGTEMIDGTPVDRAIGARMLDWMNTLTAAAYQNNGIDPATGGLSYVRDDDGRPKVNDGQGARFVARVKSYQGLLDFMHEEAAFFGWFDPTPSKRGL
jgi:hypothetical protein